MTVLQGTSEVESVEYNPHYSTIVINLTKVSDKVEVPVNQLEKLLHVLQLAQKVKKIEL